MSPNKRPCVTFDFFCVWKEKRGQMRQKIISEENIAVSECQIIAKVREPTKNYFKHKLLRGQYRLTKVSHKKYGDPHS